MHTLTRSLLALAAVFALTVFTSTASAAAKKGPVDKPVVGKITAIDKDAKTVTVGDRVISVDDTTTISNAGKLAKFEDLKTGEDATVSVFMLGEKLTATNLKVGKVAANTAALPKKKK